MDQFAHRIAQIDCFELQILLAREGQQLANKTGSPVGILIDLHQIAIVRVAAVGNNNSRSLKRRQGWWCAPHLPAGQSPVFVARAASVLSSVALSALGKAVSAAAHGLRDAGPGRSS